MSTEQKFHLNSRQTKRDAIFSFKLKSMSTPISSLSKFRKVPIVKTSTDEKEKGNTFRYSNETNDLLNEVTTRMATNRTREFHTGPTDLDLLQLTMTRMQKAESDLRHSTSELKEKTRRIAVLEEKVQIYEKAFQSQRDESFKISVLEEKCRRLQSIIDRMEDLLIERGLEVVGELNEPDNVNILTFDEADRAQPTWRPDESIPSILPIDFNVLVENIRELNVLAGETEMHFEKSDRHISTLKRPEPIQLTIYANGIFLFNGPFRSFSEPSTQQFIRDVLDGFFPSELQKRFPDGVPFKLTDKRDVVFTDGRKAQAFHGDGYVLHDGRVVHSKDEEKSSELPVERISAERFLNRLPKVVIKNGQIIDVRQNVENHLTGRSNFDEIQPPQSARSEIDPSSPFSTLRIRSHDGQQTYVIKMKITSTIKQVKQTIAKKKKLPFEFDLFVMGTKTIFNDENRTLEECGLVPNATLGIRQMKNPSS